MAESKALIPDYRLTVDGKDITPTVAARLISLRLEEKRDGSADQLDLVLDDSDGKLAIPSEGAVITVQLGWKQGTGVTPGLVDKGRFKVDEANHSGPPDQVTVRARSADLAGDYRVRRERSWTDTTLGDVLGEIAGANGLQLSIDPDLRGVQIPALASHEKSDMALVRELGRRYDAVATVKAGKLVFNTKGKGQTPGGQPIPDTVIGRGVGDRHDYRRLERSKYGGAEARWHDSDAGTRKTVSAGSGQGKKKRMRRVYASESAAKEAASAEARRVARGAAELELNLAIGNAALYPDRPCTVSGFKPEIDAHKWLIGEVRHELTKKGFRTALKLETRG